MDTPNLTGDSGSAQPLVSVIIPMFNHARYVETCLTSVVGSDYRPLEIVGLDDGSTDGTFEVAQAWSARQSDSTVSVRLMRQANQGVTKTLNRLIRVSGGEYLALLASDDYLLPGGIRARVQALQNHPEWLAVFGDAIMVDGDGRQIHASALEDFLGSDKRALANPQAIGMELILRWGIPGGAHMIRRAAYDATHGIGWYDETLPFEDRDFYLRALARDGVGFVDGTVSAYRWHAENFFKAKDAGQLARYYEGLQRCENSNARLFEGQRRWALRLSAQLAGDLAGRAAGKRGLHPMMQKAIRLTLKLLYRLHAWRARSPG